jgi:maltose/moltooligosaccharide transporter
VLWLGVICLWLLDIGNNTSMEPYRALLSERLPDSQVARGFLTQSMFTGAGAVLANLSLFILQKVIVGNAGNGVPYWMYSCFMIGTVVILVTMLVAMIRTKEIKPSAEMLAEIDAAPKGLGAAVKDIAVAVKDMPVAMHKIGVAFLFQWYAMFIYWQFLAVSLGESIFNADPETGGEAWDQAISWSGLENAAYNFVTMIVALFLVGWCQKIGAKRVHALCLGFAAVSLVWLANISNPYVALLPMIGMGIAWASMTGVPSLMVVTMVPSRRIGVYLGILNMMVVVPMLIQTLTFGWIYEHLLGGKGTNAIMLAGVLLGCGAISMLWVNSPRPDEESPIVPLGAPRHFATVYDEVIVGSDGTPTSLVAVGHAAGVAHAADARLVVVTAYDPHEQPADQADEGGRQLLYGERRAEAAMEASVRELTVGKRVRPFEQRIVAAPPARALLQAAGDNPKNLIVVGNRGLGAEEGQMLGSVPGEVVAHAMCNVLVVQTTRHAEDLAALTAVMEIPPADDKTPREETAE